MKKYITPHIEDVMVAGAHRLMAASEAYNQPGDGTTGQLSKRHQGWDEWDDED